VHDCFTRREGFRDLVEGIFRPEAHCNVFEQAWYATEMPACASHLVAVICERGSNRPPDLAGGSGKEYSHFSIP
jgi:hypothetical protein